MRKILFPIALFLCVLSAKSQEEKAFSFDLYGFIRNDFYYDSRQNMESAGGLFYMIPKDRSKLGEDLNDIPSSRFLSIASRVGLNIKGPEIFGANSSTKIETDFAGFSGSTTMLRIRQAWTKLTWTKFDLLMGQTWHPMFGDVVPDVMSLATGSPFQPFNRSPQLRIDYKIKSFRTYLSALYQLQYASVGPKGASTEYLVNGMLPELYFGLDYKKDGWILGAGVDFLRLRPRTIGYRNVEKNQEPVSVEVKVSDNISSFSVVAFAQYSNKKFSIKAKSIYGQNMSNLLLLSGYGVSKINNDGSYEYTNLSNSTSWINITYGYKYQIGLFAGYSKNLGSSDELLSTDQVYVHGDRNLDRVFRIAPQISYNLKHWTLGVEYEMTTAAYGTLDLSDGKVKDTHNITNNRIVGVMMYKF